VVLEKNLFDVAVNPKTLALYIRVYLANKRQGTASTKTRGEVSGSTRKIYRQKGTGRARHGDIKAPIFVGGGVVFGPKPRDYSLKINKKQKRQAFLGALTYQFKNKGVLVFDDSFLTIKPKTNELFDFFVKNNLASEKKLIVLPKMEKNNLVLAGRNISNLKFTSLESLNAYQILNTKKLIFLEEALKSLAKKYGN
jgi:large subunit ribosomal protein L4